MNPSTQAIQGGVVLDDETTSIDLSEGRVQCQALNGFGRCSKPAGHDGPCDYPRTPGTLVVLTLCGMLFFAIAGAAIR